jgi:hypothetical protein
MPRLAVGGVLFCCWLAVTPLAFAQSVAQQSAAVGRPLTGYPSQDVSVMDAPGTAWSKHPITEKEYFAQPNEWTCSASSYIMALRVLGIVDIDIDDAVARTCAKEGSGADNGQVVRAFERLGPGYQVVNGQSSSHQDEVDPNSAERLAERKAEHARLGQLLNDGYVVILNFREPEDGGGHYGVLQAINNQAIEIADPYFGLRSVLLLSRFDFRSGYSKPVRHGWFVAIRRKN